MKNTAALAACLTAALLLPSAASSGRAEGERFRDLLVRMRAAFAAVNDFTCHYDTVSVGPERTDRVSYRLRYRAPGLLRLDVLDGRYQDSVLVYRDGVIRVRLGGSFMSRIPFTMDPEHRWMVDARGHRVYEASPGWFIDKHLSLLPHLGNCRITSSACDGRAAILVTAVSSDPARTQGIAREEIWVDRDRLVLLQFRQYDSQGRMVQSSRYRDLMINGGTDEALFSME